MQWLRAWQHSWKAGSRRAADELAAVGQHTGWAAPAMLAIPVLNGLGHMGRLHVICILDCRQAAGRGSVNQGAGRLQAIASLGMVCSPKRSMAAGSSLILNAWQQAGVHGNTRSCMATGGTAS